ncbi:MAG: putative Lactoylglutathione lyase [Cyanobacteria bacterium RYN_339]|nr:putative Lactoylglutathione lyase [Cyanobacteria bacterium RYN_339]
MPVKEIAFTMYPVSDLKRAVAFYTDVLGLKQSGLASDAWVEFDINGACFGVGNFPQIGTPGTAGSLALEIDDLDAFRKELAAKGHETGEPYETPVCFITAISDPDGNKVVLHKQKAHAH